MKLIIEVEVSSCDDCPVQREWRSQGSSWYYCGLVGFDPGNLKRAAGNIPSWCPAKEKNT